MPKRVIIELASSTDKYLYLEPKILKIVKSTFDFIRKIDHIPEGMTFTFSFEKQEMLIVKEPTGIIFEEMSNKSILIDEENKCSSLEKRSCQIVLVMGIIENTLKEIKMDLIATTYDDEHKNEESETFIVDNELYSLIEIL